MKITRVIPRVLEWDMGGRLWNPQRRWSTKQAVLVFLESEDGHVGVGEAWASGASTAALVNTIEDEIAPLLVGESVFASSRAWSKAWHTTELSTRRGIVSAALGAANSAQWDLVGKITGQPLFQLLGAESDTVPCYASAGLYGTDKGLDELADEMRGYLARGFTDVKMKVGGVPLADDVARVAAVREVIGANGRLMVDSVYQLDVPGALRMARAFAPFDIYWFEAPVSPDDIAGQARVNAAGGIPVCGNETEYGRDRFKQLIEARAVEFVQFDIAACGGVTEGRRIADLAGAFHLPCTLHAASTSVLLATTLHLAAALPNVDSVEYHMLHQWLWDRAPADTFAVSDNRVRPPAGAGIGIDLHYDDLD